MQPPGLWKAQYQVMKKWLSHREKALLGRDLEPEEVREVMRMARRITAIPLLQPQLDANFLGWTRAVSVLLTPACCPELRVL
ncbi:MAG: hypothetical protein JW990_00905 [Thermoleophilia bacterium]|nr:hypothetical protein [Thermoleophilia bacterium]